MSVDPFVSVREGMVAGPAQGLTMILGRARAGDDRARGELIALIYDAPRRVVSVTTVEDDWRLARAWLAGQLGGGDR
jgi:hypothetical protein